MLAIACISSTFAENSVPQQELFQSLNPQQIQLDKLASAQQQLDKLSFSMTKANMGTATTLSSLLALAMATQLRDKDTREAAMMITGLGIVGGISMATFCSNEDGNKEERERLQNYILQNQQNTEATGQ